MSYETAFTLDTSSIKFGPGVTRELGHDLKRLGVTRVMVVTDPRLRDLQPVATAVEAIHGEGLEALVFDQVRVEPTDESFREAITFAQESRVDGFVSVGGGSSMDTAKAANLYATHPADLLDYVNSPIGRGLGVPGPLRPHVAVPTTSGTGSETTGVAIFDLLEMHAKTGIAHRFLRPTMGYVDPDHVATLPPTVAACSGLDVLSHAIESLTALPFHRRQRPDSPAARPAYQGANPISDIWSSRAIEIVARYLVRSIGDPNDLEAQTNMMLAATYAGIGFGNAGVHLPHGMSYPVSGHVRSYRPDGYPPERAIVPHGMAVILNAPAVFRFTAEADPERHLMTAGLLGADVSGAAPEDAGELLAAEIIALMRATGMPNGLADVGFVDADADALADGTLPQHRVTKLSPRPADRKDLKALFLAAMRYW